MTVKLTPKSVAEAAGPTDGKPYILYNDSEITGLGLRVTAAAYKAFTFTYRTHSGVSRRLTIGNVDDWPLKLAREEARRLRRLVDTGRDPMGERHEQRTAPMVRDLVERWRAEKAAALRSRTRTENESMITGWIMPALGSLKVADVKRADIQKLHRTITASGARVRANRTVALVRYLFALSVEWEMRLDNPANGIKPNPEEKRERYLEGDEMARLFEALASQPNRTAANIIELLLLTGARRSEVMRLRWDQVNFTTGVWTKPASTTKQKKLHRVPLNEPALELLTQVRKVCEDEAAKYGHNPSEWVFPTRRGRARGPVVDIKHVWNSVRRETGLADVRLHDLRHQFASVVASNGGSLPLIGALLGHSQASTTQRYAHLFAATDQAGAVVDAAKNGRGRVAPLKRA
jgi:integrase